MKFILKENNHINDNKATKQRETFPKWNNEIFEIMKREKMKIFLMD